jgi:hypothetical protein
VLASEDHELEREILPSMGGVYRTCDTRLGRNVVITVDTVDAGSTKVTSLQTLTPSKGNGPVNKSCQSPQLLIFAITMLTVARRIACSGEGSYVRWLLTPL